MDGVPAVDRLAERLAPVTWVHDLWIAGSLATSDHVPGVSDLDLVAVVNGPIDDVRQQHLTDLHRELDEAHPGADLGCVYVDETRLGELGVRHPTWTHGGLVQRILSGITRAELVRHGQTRLGRPPTDLLRSMCDDDVRMAARVELRGYWARAVLRPALWLDPRFADLSLTSMARGRHTIRTGQLLTKSAAIEHVDAPAWLVRQLAARRVGEPAVSPRFRTAVIAWRDARRTVALAAGDA